jgi:hypothetical protein
MFMVTSTADDVNPWFLLGVLNSLPLRAFWVDRFWDRRRTFPKIKGTYLKALPLPARSHDDIADLARVLTRHREELASTTLAARRQMLERSMDAAQDRLDRQVAGLFGIPEAALTDLSALVTQAGARDGE